MFEWDIYFYLFRPLFNIPVTELEPENMKHLVVE